MGIQRISLPPTHNKYERFNKENILFNQRGTNKIHIIFFTNNALIHLA